MSEADMIARTVESKPLRPGEITIELPGQFDAGLYFIGRIRTPWRVRQDCPRQGDRIAGPECFIELHERYRAALTGVARQSELQILYWMDAARRDLAVQFPRSHGDVTGTFALRSPVRPNPIASAVVALVRVETDGLVVKGLDCLDGTPLLDVKPVYCHES
jgi:tRNA (adenine37-N6)-methyltransferase